MSPHSVQLTATCLVLSLATALYGAEPSRTRSRAHETTYVKATCKVFVREDGIPKGVEFLKFEPPIASSVQGEVKETISKAVLTWTFKPNQKNGKPVAGYIIVPFNLDLAFPIPVDGT